MKFTRHDIGGELISIITKGMYADPKDALREYVQNGVDATAKSIILRIKHDSITIIDDGVGMDKNIMRKAVRVGISDKNPKKSVGFMGIGLYSSFHLCNTLTIYSRVKDQDPYQLTFHFDKMREFLENQKSLRLLAKPTNESQIDLQTLLENTIDFEELKLDDFPLIGTRVEMHGLESNFFKSLSKQEEVAEYLERVVPLPFSPLFTHGEKISEQIEAICKKHKLQFRTINLTLEINGNEQKLYRPYKDSDFKDRSNPDDKPMKPEYFEMTSSDGFLGLAWGCLNSGRKTIPNGKIRGFIIKKHGFTIGKREDVLIHFNRKIFFDRYIGEFIAVHPKLLPNGPRTEFEYSSIRNTFYASLKVIANKYVTIAEAYQEQEKAKEQLSEAIESYNEITAQIGFFQENGDKLLELFQELDTIQKKLDDKLKAKKFVGENILKANETIKAIKILIVQIKELLDIKKKKKKSTIKKPKTVASKIISQIKISGNESSVDSLKDLITSFGLEINDDLLAVIELIDEKFIKSTSNNRKEYDKKLLELKNDIEDLIESD